MSFSADIQALKGATLLIFHGSLIEKSQAVEAMEEIYALAENGSNNFILDFKDMEYMNSTGLNILINILTKARSHGGEVVICNLQETIKKLLVITKLNAVFSIVETREEAMQKLNLS